MLLPLHFTTVMALLPFQLHGWLVAGSTVVPSAASMMDHATSSSAVSSTNSVSSSRPSSECFEAGVAENCVNASRDGTVMLIIPGTVAETSLFVFGIISRGLVGRFSLDIFPVLAPLPWPSLNETVLDVQPMCPLFYRLHPTMALYLYGTWRRASL